MNVYNIYMSVQKTEDEWREELSEEEYRGLRQKGTEVPHSGEYVYSKEEGEYVCKGCGAKLFKSDAKYDSTTPGLIGWPSFSDAIEGAVEYKNDDSIGMSRTEVVCAKCHSHLGHIFDDSSSPNGKHYCVNSVCLDFKKK
jgi:peptide-methionine (R)-S-oxide reductase